MKNSNGKARQPSTDRHKATAKQEIDFLQQKSHKAKHDLQEAVKNVGQSIAHNVRPREIVRKYPWQTAAAAVAAGLGVFLLVFYRKREEPATTERLAPFVIVPAEQLPKRKSHVANLAKKMSKRWLDTGIAMLLTWIAAGKDQSEATQYPEETTLGSC